MHPIDTFFTPYVLLSMVIGASSLRNLEGAFGGFISFQNISTAPNFLASIALLLLALAFGASLIVTWRYSPKRSFPLTLMLWILPGLLEMAGCQGISDKLHPDNTFVVWGGPQPRPIGSVDEAFAFLITAFVLGWSFLSFAFEVFRAAKRFRALYEYVWVAVGLTTAIFYVLDKDTTQLTDKIKATDTEVMSATSTLSEQFGSFRALCSEPEPNINGQRPSADFCNWVRISRTRLSVLKGERDFIRTGIPFSNVEDFFSAGTEKYRAHERIEELQRINDAACSDSTQQVACDPLPVPLFISLLAKKLISEDTEIDRPYALAAEPLIRLIHTDTQEGFRLINSLRRSIGLANLRWLSFVLLAFVAGGKAALATREIYRSREKETVQTTIASPVENRSWLLGRSMHFILVMLRSFWVAVRRSISLTKEYIWRLQLGNRFNHCWRKVKSAVSSTRRSLRCHAIEDISNTTTPDAEL